MNCVVNSQSVASYFFLEAKPYQTQLTVSQVSPNFLSCTREMKRRYVHEHICAS